jgi:hypothetical protein
MRRGGWPISSETWLPTSLRSFAPHIRYRAVIHTIAAGHFLFTDPWVKKDNRGGWGSRFIKWENAVLSDNPLEIAFVGRLIRKLKETSLSAKGGGISERP